MSQDGASNNENGADGVALASAADAAALAEVGARTFVETFGHLYKPDDLQAFLADNHTPAEYQALVADDRYRVWLARHGGAVIGYAVAGLCNLPVDGLERGAGEIKRLYILAGHQTAGLGTRMMDSMMLWLDEAGYDPLYISVYAGNHGAQRFYRRYGFEKILAYDFMVGTHRDPEFIFERRQAH